MTAHPKVSVLMTVYNASPYLRETLDSLIAQTFADWELVAVENGSTDDSAQILASYADPRIKIFALPRNIGRTPALRYGAERAMGEYVAVLDADDVATPRRLMLQVRALDEDPALGLVGGWAELINERSEHVGAYEPTGDHAGLVDQLGWTNPFVHSATTFRASLMRKLGGYPATVVYAQDYALILDVAANSKVGMIDEVLCRLREASTTMTADPSLRLVRAEEELALLREAVRLLPLSAAARRRNRHRQSVAKLKMSLALLRSTRAIEGLRMLVGVLVTSPRAFVENGALRRRLAAWR